MTKLCPRGKAAAKRKFKVYPSAYANAYASKICAGKIKDPSGVKRKDFRGPKPAKAEGGRIYKFKGGPIPTKRIESYGPKKGTGKSKPMSLEKAVEKNKQKQKQLDKRRERMRRMGGGMMQMPRAMYKNGGMTKAKGAGMGAYSSVKDPKVIKNLLKIPLKAKTKEGRVKKMGGGMMQMPRAMYKKGGKSFPDLSGDGKVTMKDILMGRGVIPRKGKKGGGLMEATSRLRAQGLKAGGVAKGCGAVMNDRRKVTKMY